MNSNYTRQIFMDSLKRLAQKRRLTKITVSDIVDDCKLNRGTFYYHFRDKDDLINAIFQSDILDYFQEAKEKDWTHNTYHFLTVMRKDCSFYSQALEIDSYYNLRKLLYDMNFSAALSIIDHALEGRKLSARASNFIADFYASAFTGTNIHYIKSGAKQSPEKMLQYYYDLSEPCIFISLEQFIAHDRSKGMLPISKN